MLVSIDRIRLLLNWLHLWLPAHLLAFTAMRVNSCDEEAATIILDIMHIVARRLFLLQAAGFGRLLVRRCDRGVLVRLGHGALMLWTCLRIPVSLFFAILILLLEHLKVIDVDLEFILLLLHLILLKHVNLGNIVLGSERFVGLRLAIHWLLLATCRVIVLVH